MQKILLIFNKFFISFLKDVKECASDDVKIAIRKKYKVVDKQSTEHIERFWNVCEPHFVDFVSLSNIDLGTSQKIKDIELFESGISFSQVLESFSDTTMFWNHLNILLVFAYLFNEEADGWTRVAHENDTKDSTGDTDDNDVETSNTSINETETSKVNENCEAHIETLLSKVVDVISAIQRGDDDIDFEEILDDDVKCLLSKLSKSSDDDEIKVEIKEGEPSKKSNTSGFNIEDVFGNMTKDSKIANLAKEISDEIDVSSLNIKNPEDIMKMMDFSSGNNVMGDIIKKVSSKISNKIEKGELGQEELLGEAMSMMGKSGGLGGLSGLFNNPMMSEVMKSMKKGKPMQTKNDVFTKASTRDRLRKKLDKKKSSAPKHV